MYGWGTTRTRPPCTRIGVHIPISRGRGCLPPILTICAGWVTCLRWHWRVGIGTSNGVLRENHVLQDAIFIHNLVDKMSGRYRHRIRDWGFLTCANHPDCSWTLYHLNLFPKLKTDCLPLVNVKVHSVLTTLAILSLVSVLASGAHCHSDTMLIMVPILNRTIVDHHWGITWIISLVGVSHSFAPFPSHKGWSRA